MFDILNINKNKPMENNNLSTGKLRIVPFGAGDVTKNMFLYETDREILIVDCGIGFPQEEMFGIDLIIPDITYLQKRLQEGKKIVGLILTHGHDDHIGALPYILPQLSGLNVQVYASPLTKKFIETQLEDFKLQYKINAIDADQALRLGSFEITFVRMTHSVPDALHLIIKTPVGIIYHGSDFKFDWTPLDGVLPEAGKIAAAGNAGVLCLLSDCLNAEERGYSESEKDLVATFETEMAKAKGKFIFTTQSSNILRIKLLMQLALKNNRKIGIVGRSIDENLEDARELGLLNDLPAGIYVREEKIGKFNPQNLCLIVAGSQGQVSSALSRIASGEHQIKIEEGDTVIISGDPIPGNERPISFLIDSLTRRGAKVLHSRINDQLHVTGHAKQEEMKFLIGLTRPKFLLPIGGTFAHMVAYKQLAEDMGYAKNQIFLPEEQEFLETDGRTTWIPKEKIQSRNILVDGLGVGDVGNVVLRDRKTLATEGMLIAIVSATGEKLTAGDVEIVSRGFIYMKENQEFVEVIKNEIVATVSKIENLRDMNYLQRKIISHLEKFIYRETKRRPLILVDVLEV
jgi:ribonuclease J